MQKVKKHERIFLKGDFHFLILSVRSCTQYTTPNNANTHTHTHTHTPTHIHTHTHRRLVYVSSLFPHFRILNPNVLTYITTNNALSHIISPNILIVTIRFIHNFEQIHRQGMEPPAKMSYTHQI